MKPIYLMLLSLFMANLSCGFNENKGPVLRVYNMSDKAIYAQWTTNNSKKKCDISTNPMNSGGSFQKIEANSVQGKYYGAPSEAIFDDIVDTLVIYIFDAQVLESTPFDTVQANCLILKRYNLSLDDLNRLNWKVTYP